MLRLAAALALIAAAPAVQPELAGQDRRAVTTIPDRPARWDGRTATGLNTTYDAASGEPCGEGLEDQCDTTLLRVEVPDGYWDTRDGGVQVHLGGFFPNPTSDFDLYIYVSDAAGSRGRLIATSADLPGLPESAEIPEASGFYLVQVVYFAVTASRYTAVTRFVSRPPRPPVPDVDRPAGLQDVLASNPARGFRSRSEPHIAQSPTNRNLLVAASKMYNRDRDSLREYEFKIGSYVSFDGARSWTDLGQTRVCPARQAPPRSWPGNACYPDEDPARDGTGAEDARGRGGRAGGDFGEEYITSDPWVQFDDEGNAYLMVLDAPSFEFSGNGWGMSMHRWQSVSPDDLRSGDTWGPKIVINSYPDEVRKATFLDDKNTFAINNAGPDRDGKTGIIIACWGQNIRPLIKQQQVCARSADAGRTWGAPVPISGLQQLEIGVAVVADNVDPNAFYAMWLHYLPGRVGAPDELWVARTADGGRSWSAPVRAATLTGIPRQFPGQRFRNLSLPSLAAGRRRGELYAVYADYRPARPGLRDADGRQADIMLVRSTDGGLTWSAPMRVNSDRTNADQFQPSVAVTPSGQVNVSFFDRRHDPRNFYIDTYLARFNGRGFSETRVSHEMWDPSINPPVSPSGEFIGDYQGLVADDCVAIPFVNDTHLAGRGGRDPDLDRGVARSPYQQVFSWRVPNTAAFGGRPVREAACPADRRSLVPTG